MLFKSKFSIAAGRILLLLPLLCSPAAFAQSNFTLRVMAANITSGNYQSYETAGIHIFQGLKPDLVAIQEFRYNASSSDAQLRQLVDVAFGTNFSYYREPGYNIPNGIVSRWPILEAGSWDDPLVNDRGFAWARIDLPGTNDLYVVSVHLYSSGSATDRNTEATTIKNLIENNFPAGAWVIVGGDFNTGSRTESAVTTFQTFLSDRPVPTDNATPGNPDTNEPRNKPYDYLLPAFSLTNYLTSVALPSRSFDNGLVFDSAVFTPLSDVPPVAVGDSHTTGMQHMPVIKDFLLTAAGTNSPTKPSITSQPESQLVEVGSNATFNVVASGTAPFHYQWRFNETNIANTTTESYTVTNAQSEDAGQYSVVVTNRAGSVTSSNATLTVAAAPVITQQPQSLTVGIGDDATFTVFAGGVTPLSYQWRFYGTNIAGATTNFYTRTNVQQSDAGDYSAVITNSEGSITSKVANLTVGVVGAPEIFAQWNFNSPTPDNDVTTGTTAPSTGSGTASLVGGATVTFATGDTVLDPAGTDDNSGWNTANFPAANANNKTAGAQFNVSTAGKQRIVVTWSSRASNTGSKYARLQYSTNGTTFQDFPSAVTNLATTYAFQSNNLAAVTGVNNNSNFAIRIVSEWESTATGTGSDSYVAANPGSTYGSPGTLRFDMVTVSGSAIIATNPPPTPAILSNATLTNRHFEMRVIGTTGSNYIIQISTNLGTAWNSILTNTSPFTFVDTSTAETKQRFYRALAQ